MAGRRPGGRGRDADGRSGAARCIAAPGLHIVGYQSEPSRIPIRLTYEHRPLAGALVVAQNRRDPAAKIAVRSDKDGRVRVRLPAAGMWLIKVVHMVPAPVAPESEWASYWASLTFELKAPATAPVR